MNALGICVKLGTRISGIQGARECDIRPKTSDFGQSLPTANGLIAGLIRLSNFSSLR
jgi:hypothetical protein